MASKRNFTEEEIDQMVLMYTTGWSYAKIAKQFDCDPSAIMYNLKKIPGFKPRTTKETARKYTADWDFFEVIDTQDKAYWLGFIYADGYISKNPSHLMGVTLAQKDEAHLHILKSDLSATNPVLRYEPSGGYGKDPYVRFVVISDKLVSDIERHGVVSNKTNILMPPTTIPDHLIPHFIRGYFDGDGSWAKTSKAVGYKFAVTGTEEMVLWIAEQIGIIPRLYQRYPERGMNNYTLEATSKKDLQKIIQYMYPDNMRRFLVRKLSLAMKIRPLVEESTSAHPVNSGKA